MSAKRKLFVAAACVVALGAIVAASSSANPRLEMAVVSRSVKKDFGECVIGLTNNGSSITYVGYSKDSPVFTCVRDTPAGVITNFLGLCGTGLGERTLASGEGVQFKAFYVGTNAPTRILLSYKETRWLDRLIARAPALIRSKLPPREWRSAEVRLSG